ncbi:SAM-dependent methyltransferase [Kitasatospora mediocidica]|uniref:SAM-dependent methyltransferase n=1 Tax=Kitasatospora mediocidica TaxID=58352 RepID=UPI00055E60A5|nr:SAM-dependent methyltransferase [Kitasatospora mediocidica]
MTTHGIPEGVGHTALGVARARAIESRRPDRLFDDPYAAAFVTAAYGEPAEPKPGEVAPGLVAMARHLVVRTRFFDDYLLRATAEGCTQVVVPAAGLDTRAFRLPWPDGVSLFEIDLPEISAFKERVLAEQGAVPACRRSSLVADLREDWAAVLTGAGFDPAARSVWLIEGLLIYLDAADAARLLTVVGELSAPGSRLALTHGAGRRDRELRGQDQVAPELAAVAALWRGGLDEDPVDWLARDGWQAVRHDRAEAAASYGRPDYVSPQARFVTAERVGAEQG